MQVKNVDDGKEDVFGLSILTDGKRGVGGLIGTNLEMSGYE